MPSSKWMVVGMVVVCRVTLTSFGYMVASAPTNIEASFELVRSDCSWVEEP